MLGLELPTFCTTIWILNRYFQMVKEYSWNMVYNLKHLPIWRSWSYFQSTVSFVIQGTGRVVHFSFITIQDVSGKLVYQFSPCNILFSTPTPRKGGLMRQVVGLPKNSYKPITNTVVWVRARVCKLQKGAFASQSQVIKFTSCLLMVDGSLRVLRPLPPLRLIAMI